MHHHDLPQWHLHPCPMHSRRMHPTACTQTRLTPPRSKRSILTKHSDDETPYLERFDVAFPDDTTNLNHGLHSLHALRDKSESLECTGYIKH